MRSKWAISRCGPEYWPNCQRLLGFQPVTIPVLDDDEGCLIAARTFGVAHLVHSAQSVRNFHRLRSPQFFLGHGFAPLLNDRPTG